MSLILLASFGSARAGGFPRVCVESSYQSSLSNNYNATFYEIAVRSGTASGSDPFTVLMPRQPVTAAPFAVNAQTAGTATNVSGGYVQLPQIDAAPPTVDCDETVERGRIKADTTNNKLYVCTATGWKSTLLQ